MRVKTFTTYEIDCPHCTEEISVNDTCGQIGKNQDHLFCPCCGGAVSLLTGEKVEVDHKGMGGSLIIRLVRDGHTAHCAYRQIYGDGERECQRKSIIPGTVSEIMVQSQVNAPMFPFRSEPEDCEDGHDWIKVGSVYKCRNCGKKDDPYE